jgi:hypothetical protein
MQTAYDSVRMGILKAPYCFSKRAAWPHDSVTGVALWTHPSREDITHCDNGRTENANGLLVQARRGEGRWGSLEREIQYMMPQSLE